MYAIVVLSYLEQTIVCFKKECDYFSNVANSAMSKKAKPCLHCSSLNIKKTSRYTDKKYAF